MAEQRPADDLPRKWDGNLHAWVGIPFAGASLYFMAMVLAYAHEIAKLPASRFQGGHGFSLNAPVLLNGFLGLALALLAAVLLITALLLHGWKSGRLPNILSGILIAPAVYVGLMLGWRIITIFFKELSR